MRKYKKIYIEITNICNLKCSFCSPVTKKRRFMTKNEFEEILKKISNYTDYIYLHVKGEPLLHSEIIEFINLASKYHLKVNLTTNGTLFKELAKSLGKAKALHKINFSLHSENNLDDYPECIFDNIKYLPKDTTAIYRLWTLHDNKLDKKSQEIVHKIEKYYNLPQETVDKIKNENNIKINSTIYVDKDNAFIWPEESSYQSNGYCYALKTQIAILVDGTVVPCCLDANGNVPLGNIYEQSLEEIINSPKYQNLKKSFQDRKPCERLCKSCRFKERFK